MLRLRVLCELHPEDLVCEEWVEAPAFRSVACSSDHFDLHHTVRNRAERRQLFLLFLLIPFLGLLFCTARNQLGYRCIAMKCILAARLRFNTA